MSGRRPCLDRPRPVGVGVYRRTDTPLPAWCANYYRVADGFRGDSSAQAERVGGRGARCRRRASDGDRPRTACRSVDAHSRSSARRTHAVRPSPATTYSWWTRGCGAARATGRRTARAGSRSSPRRRAVLTRGPLSRHLGARQARDRRDRNGRTASLDSRHRRRDGHLRPRAAHWDDINFSARAALPCPHDPHQHCPGLAASGLARGRRDPGRARRRVILPLVNGRTTGTP